MSMQGLNRFECTRGQSQLSHSLSRPVSHRTSRIFWCFAFSSSPWLFLKNCRSSFCVIVDDVFVVFFFGTGEEKRNKTNCWLSTISLRPRRRREKNEREWKGDEDAEIMWWTNMHKEKNSWHVISKIGYLSFPSFFPFFACSNTKQAHVATQRKFPFAYGDRERIFFFSFLFSPRPFVKVTFNYRKLAKHFCCHFRRSSCVFVAFRVCE